jgi:hypothetical protein
MIKVAVYIYVNGLAKRLDLFNDEKISITSTIQNVNDISKTFTDYTQSFSVPASNNNNAIFKHWYNNDIDNGFNQRKRVDGYIELDSISFKSGKIQLESTTLINGQPENYKITFFGSLVSLKDTFNGLYLKDLTVNRDFDLEYTPTIVKDLVVTNSTSSNVMFPLISSKNIWEYGSGYDVSDSATPIVYSDLFPAIRLNAVLHMIESQFGITFNGTFLSDSRFVNAYLWLKNAEEFKVKATTDLVTWENVTYGNDFVVDLTNETFHGSGNLCLFEFANIYITPTASGITYDIHTYKNGVEILKQSLVSIVGTQTLGITSSGGGGLFPTDIYSIKISSNVPLTFDATLVLSTIYDDGFGGTFQNDITITKSSAQTTTSSRLPIKDYFPEIKIEDFFSGLLKQFNLTCYSTVQNVYQLETIENYYSTGNIIDISKYITVDTQNIDRVKTYNKIKFEYEKSENVISANFLSTNSRSFGDLSQDFESDGSEYAVKLPFECYSFSQLSGNLIAGYALKFDLKQYIPKPVILYDLNPTALTSCPSFYFGASTYSAYKVFSNETIINTVYYSLVWGAENSLLTSSIPISLYSNYYQNYLENVFNEKARLVKSKALFPLSIMSTLRLKDRLIIRDKRYIINQMNIDVTTGETTLELLTDFRDIIEVTEHHYSSLHYSSLHYST